MEAPQCVCVCVLETVFAAATFRVASNRHNGASVAKIGDKMPLTGRAGGAIKPETKEENEKKNERMCRWGVNTGRTKDNEEEGDPITVDHHGSR